MANTYLKAALITAALVLLGFFFISQLDAMRTAELSQSVDALVLESDSERLLLLYSQVMDNSSNELCGYAASNAQSKASQAYSLLEKINYYEKSNLMSGEYEQIRNRYYLSNAGLYLNLQAMKKYCGSYPYVSVLYFYKISEDCPSCRAQGGVLDNLRAKYPNLRVFAFPIDSNVGIVNALADRHKITTAPALVVEDKDVLLGLQDEGTVSKSIQKFAGQ